MKKAICNSLIFIILFTFYSCRPKQNKQTFTTTWFPFTPKNQHEQGIIGMQHWLEKPAGKHGFVQIDGANLRCEDGTPIKFWGTNICSRLPFSNAEKVDSFVHFLSKFGINAVRFHKFTRHAYNKNQSTDLLPEKYKNFDYFHFALRKTGIYTGWSHIYGHKVLPEDSAGLIAYQEVKNLTYNWGHLNGSTSGLVNFAPDLQQLSINLTVNMLNHINPHTGLRYADDPALAFIEFQNEDNIFWSAVEKALEQAPTYRKLLCMKFSDWLLEKYGSQQELTQAWGSKHIPAGESLTKKNIYPQPNHGLFGWEYETAIKENRPMAQHVLDKMRFLYEEQMKFYQKFEEAIRQTGYKGVLVASCWQAGSGVSHFYNLHSDYAIGMIDRHNYFGGGAGRHRLDTGRVKNQAMLAIPGSGLLSVGMQQVVNRPFSFSEWMSLIPNQWTAEAAPIIAIYGMGLQGWDASFSFATDIPRFSRLLQSESHGIYNATSPLHLGFYPTLARMIYRGDVAESQVICTRNVHVHSLSTGELNFKELVTQQYDVKSFTGTVSSKTLAIGKFPVRFTKEPQKTTIPNLSQYHDSLAKIMTSVTKQLQWHYAKNDYITVNTPATKGIIGFMPDTGKITLNQWHIATTNRFAVILLTSLERDKKLNESNNILLTAIARAKNTGMKYSSTGDTLLTKGDAPLLLEPVHATITLPENSSNCKVEILDHDGLATGKFVPVTNNSFEISGKYKCIWYRIIHEK